MGNAKKGTQNPPDTSPSRFDSELRHHRKTRGLGLIRSQPPGFCLNDGVASNREVDYE